jgi:hypothetical protein
MMTAASEFSPQRIRRIALGDTLHRSARRFGERAAVIDGDRHLSYRELDEASNRFAHHLLGLGMRSGDRVAMLCTNSHEMVVAIFGIHKAGLTWLPINHTLAVRTKGGLTGMGYLQPLSGGLETLNMCLKEMVAPKVLGRDATEIEAIWQTLWKSTYWLGRGGITTFAQSAVDVALWDIVGKRAGLPLYRLWGKCRSEVPAYGSGCWRGLGRDGMIAEAKKHLAKGMTALKMQVAHVRPWREDVRNVAAMREALGPDIEIMIDVNTGWTADTAIQAGRHIDEYDPYWLEEPGRLRGLRRLCTGRSGIENARGRRREPLHAL